MFPASRRRLVTLLHDRRAIQPKLMSFIEIVGNDDPYVRDGVERNEEVHQKARIFIQAFREKFKECHDDVFPMCYAAKLKRLESFVW
jgi:hypothetical protein